MTFVDGTVGSGSYFSVVLARITPGGIAIGIDRDQQAIARTQSRIERAVKGDVEWHLVHAAFSELTRVVSRFGISEIDRICFDLGLSSEQLDDPERGFSFRFDGPLDMRQDRSCRTSARDVVNDYPVAELERLLREYGEERHSARIAKAIAERRSRSPIETTGELARIVAEAVPGRRGRTHPATRTFQALRIEVGGELEELRSVLGQAPPLLSMGGRLAVVTYHSLEDRVLKDALRPFGRHGTRTDWRLIRRGGVVRPDAAEVRENPRARSAKLRVFEKLEVGR